MLIDLLSWLLILLTPPLALLWLVVNIKKRIRGKCAKSWGFFHPFWYECIDEAMMVEVGKKFCGVWLKNWRRKLKIKSLFIV